MVSLNDKHISWLKLGIDQPGNKLPLCDKKGNKIKTKTIKECLKLGLVKKWFENPLKPDWLVCKLTEEGLKTAQNP
jgi:hypothetical protein